MTRFAVAKQEPPLYVQSPRHFPSASVRTHSNAVRSSGWVRTVDSTSARTPGFAFTEAVSFQIVRENQAEVDRRWTALIADRSKIQCGWLTHRWRVIWQVTPTRLIELINHLNQEHARRAM